MKEESRNVETGEKGIYTYRQKEDEKRKKKKKRSNPVDRDSQTSW